MMTSHQRRLATRLLHSRLVFLVLLWTVFRSAPVKSDTLPESLFIGQWTPEVLGDQLANDAIWISFWGHENLMESPPRFAICRTVYPSNPDVGVVWMHVESANNVRELIASLLLRTRPMVHAYHSGRIRKRRNGDEMFSPERVVYFIHDSNGIQRRCAFAIEADRLFDVDADMETTLSHVSILQPHEEARDGNEHEWVFGDCYETQLDASHPREEATSATISFPSSRVPQADTERGAEVEWDPVAYPVEPWSIAWGSTSLQFDNYCDYKRDLNTGDLLVRFHYRSDARSNGRLEDVVEFAYRHTRFILQRQFGGGTLHPLRRSLRGSEQFPPPDRVVLSIHDVPYVAVIPAELLFAQETTVERAINATLVFRNPAFEKMDWVEALAEPTMMLMNGNVWDEPVLPTR